MVNSGDGKFWRRMTYPGISPIKNCTSKQLWILKIQNEYHDYTRVTILSYVNKNLNQTFKIELNLTHTSCLYQNVIYSCHMNIEQKTRSSFQ